MSPRYVVSDRKQETNHRRPLISMLVGALVVLALVASLGSLAMAADGFPDVSAGHPYYTGIDD
ncbi:MAG: hypothetical protein JW990_01200, partial [Thermoleophilia bacterium]|nr:hypothetical protein [Thermoleophilia bacterium]